MLTPDELTADQRAALKGANLSWTLAHQHYPRDWEAWAEAAEAAWDAITELVPDLDMGAL